MNESVLYWSLIFTTYLAGGGTVAMIWWFRQPHPGTRARTETETGPTEPVAAAAAARARSLHHAYDTGEVYANGLADGFQARPPRQEPPWRTDDSAGWVSGPAGGNAGTWQPEPKLGPQ